MARYIDVSTGVPRNIAPITSSAGAGDATKIAQLDSNGRWDPSLMPLGIGADTAVLTTSEAIASGALVNITSAGLVRNADATVAGKEVNGFVLSAFGSGVAATVYFEGRIVGLTGLTPGALCYAGTTPGSITQTPPVASGNQLQSVGKAVSTVSVDYSYVFIASM